MKYIELIKCDLTVKNPVFRIITLKWNKVYWFEQGSNTNTNFSLTVGCSRGSSI